MDEKDRCTSNMSADQCVELDSIIDTFDRWQLVITDLNNKKSHLTEELRIVKLENERLERKNNDLEKTAVNLQRMVGTLQKQLHTMCDLEEDIRKMKAEKQSKEKEIEELNLEKNAQKIKFEQLCDRLKEQHFLEIDRLKKEMTDEKNSDVRKLQEIIEQKNAEIQQLEQGLEKSYTDKESEIVQITMDYESKLSKLKQKTSVTPAQSISANHEIFRKKLQHLKTEHEREVSHLKYTISDLQEKLASQGSTVRAPHTTAKKRRT